MNHLSSLRDERLSFFASDTDVLAVSVDPAEGERGQLAFAASLGLSFPLVPDTGRNLSLLYHAADKPDEVARRQSVLIDKDGVVRLIDQNINVLTHGQDIIAALRQMGLLN